VAAPSPSISPISRGRSRPQGNRAETYAWYAMRITGAALFVLALSHFSITHFIFDPAQQDAEWIAQNRWSEMFWRSFDWLMLMCVLIHSFLGMRTVIQDAVHAPRARTVTLSGLYLLGAILFALGSVVVFTMPGIGGA
jgi:succinate dehydrogenase / fumarate reductase, membrane anchor subunit